MSPLETPVGALLVSVAVGVAVILWAASYRNPRARHLLGLPTRTPARSLDGDDAAVEAPEPGEVIPAPPGSGVHHCKACGGTVHADPDPAEVARWEREMGAKA